MSHFDGRARLELRLTVDDDAVIQRMRVYVPAEDRIYVAGVGRRIDYDPVERPTLIVHDVV